MMENERAVELEEAVRYEEFLTTGVTLKINVDRLAERMDQEIYDEVGSDDDNESNEDDENKMTPWKKSFSELKQQMEAVPSEFGLIHKRIITEGSGDVMGQKNCRITWTYSMFHEGDELSFDVKQGETSERCNIALDGHQLALQSMRKGEEAQFIISYKFMFGELGCPPRIKPKADILMVAKLIDFVDIGDDKACDDLTSEDRRKFHIVKERVDEMHKRALDHTRNKRYKQAIPLYQSAIRHLEFCQLANEDEQKQQQKMVTTFYTELSDCYFQDSKWKKVCIMVNELRRRNAKHLKQNIDILVNEAVAVSHLEEDYKRSIKMLKEIQFIVPHNERVNSELRQMLKKKEEYDQFNKNMCSKAFIIKSNADNQEN